MTWKRHFRTVNTNPLDAAYAAQQRQQQATGGGIASKFSSMLPEVYAGHPNRIQRYYQYEDMARDSDISAALDTIADFCTQSEEQSENPLIIHYSSDPNEQEVKILKELLTQWIRINGFKSKLRKMFRDTAQNGDAFFVRDPEDHTWMWVDHYAVEMVKMSGDGKLKPEEYVIRNYHPNITSKMGTNIDDISQYRNPGSSPLSTGRPAMSSGPFQMAGAERDQRNMRTNAAAQQQAYVAIKAENMIHLALGDDMTIDFPFGKSILDPVFKTFKQKELLEDSTIIYRVQRAPERRVFYIDVGSMNGVRANAYIEGIKNDIHQRRIPNRSGGGSAIMDAAYNPLSMLDDYFFAQTPDGRGSKVEVLPSGDALGEITDLTYFTKKMARGLRIPTSYLSLGDDDQQASYNDGKLGSALIQEFRFNKYCMHLQSLIAPVFDRFFKEFVKAKGGIVDEDLFELRFNPPQNFTRYRQIELDAQQAQVYSQVAGNTRLSERFKLSRFLGLRPDELIENETLWMEENPDKVQTATGSTSAEGSSEGDLSAVGIRPGGDEGFDDLGMGDEGGDMPPEEGADLNSNAPPAGPAAAPGPPPQETI